MRGSFPAGAVVTRWQCAMCAVGGLSDVQVAAM